LRVGRYKFAGNPLPCCLPYSPWLTEIDGTYEWQKSDCSRLLDRMGEGALMFGTAPRQTSWNDFAALSDKIS
jgi:hypothetical protein